MFKYENAPDSATDYSDGRDYFVGIAAVLENSSEYRKVRCSVASVLKALRLDLSGCEIRERTRTVRSVLNGLPVLFYHNTP